MTKSGNIYFVTSILLCLASSLITVESVTTYSKWRLENMTDLFCPDNCGQDTECCVCENKRSWQLGGQVVNLHVRYTDIQGSSIVYIHRDDFNYTHTRLSRVYGRLRKLPTNICSFPSTVELVLNNNEMETLDGIDCLSSLDSIYLTNNNLEVIHNTTFRNLKGLRNLYLGNNKIGIIEPNSFSLGNGQYILDIDVSSNELESIDVTNFVLKAFCEVSYSNNRKMLQVKNELDYKTKQDETIGCGGVIEFENVSFRTFFNYSDFGLSAWNQIYKNLDLTVSLISDKLTCDCNMAEIFSDGTSIAVIRKFWQQAVEYVCERPDELNGTKFIDIFMTSPEKQDLLICNLTDFCPRKCHCFNQPSHDRVVVDCRGQNLTAMPEHLPWGNGDRYELLLAGNDIKKMEDRPYLSRVAELDLSGNPLSHISEIAAAAFPKDAKLNATGNKLSSMLRLFQNRNHSYLLSLQCSPDTSNLTQNIILGSLTGFVVIIIMLILGRLFLFHEIYIIYRRRLRRTVKSIEFDYDAYISFYDEDDQQRRWVLRNMAEYLETRGYNLFIPVRDSDLAVARDEYLRSRIQMCRNFIVILSEKYFSENEAPVTKQVFTQFEFNMIWRMYKNDMRRNLIIINFDNLSATEIYNRWVKACYRVGEIEDFTERQGLLMEIVERKLSPCCGKENIQFIYDFNARQKFLGL